METIKTISHILKDALPFLDKKSVRESMRKVHFYNKKLYAFEARRGLLIETDSIQEVPNGSYDIIKNGKELWASKSEDFYSPFCEIALDIVCKTEKNDFSFEVFIPYEKKERPQALSYIISALGRREIAMSYDILKDLPAGTWTIKCKSGDISVPILAIRQDSDLTYKAVLAGFRPPNELKEIKSFTSEG